MKRPRVSIQSIMIALVIIAVDFANVRSIETEDRAEMQFGFWSENVASVLVMSNILAIVIARIVRDGFGVKPGRWGFVVGGLVGMIATVPLIDGYLSFLESTSLGGGGMDALDRWIADSASRELLVGYGIVAGLPFLPQMSMALVCGWAAGRLKGRETSDRVGERPTKRRRLASFAILVVLLILPILMVYESSRDKEKLQGTWICTMMKLPGQGWAAASGEGGVAVGIRFEGDHYSEFNGPTSSPVGDFQVDAIPRPKWLDLVNNDSTPGQFGGASGKPTISCIYELDGDTLKVCWGASRPIDFTPDQTRPNETVLIYKRSRPAR